MTPAELELEALKLDPADRAHLVSRLIESLDTLSPAEVERLWQDAAVQRDAEMSTNPGISRSAQEVFAAAKARLR